MTGGGFDLEGVRTRSEVQSKFGNPTATDEKDGLVSETYHSRRKIARSNGYQQGYGMLTGISFGLSEFVFFPLETYRMCSRLALGQRLQVVYKNDDAIAEINVGPGIDSIRPRAVIQSAEPR